MGYSEPFPGYGLANATTVPSTCGWRLVYGTVRLDPTTISNAFVGCLVQQTPGGPYVEALRPLLSAGPLGAGDVPFMFHVNTGCSYYFTRDALNLGSVGVYNFMDGRGGR